MFLSDDELRTMIKRGAMGASLSLPRITFAAICVQALKNNSRLLISREHIKELLDDPDNQVSALLSIDTLEKLCRQAMERPET